SGPSSGPADTAGTPIPIARTAVTAATALPRGARPLPARTAAACQTRGGAVTHRGRAPLPSVSAALGSRRLRRQGRPGEPRREEVGEGPAGELLRQRHEVGRRHRVAGVARGPRPP